ncbi:unnamed protein product [Symbiodinium necroappetens]|uniref:SAP domain-containing protein n=1 Tax=Symbiodinium necroappetens TaxID=1628268 RepID=A0A812Z2Q2_9DINO|nr:unnamed protein product [Symbiodinium necroappetens]
MYDTAHVWWLALYLCESRSRLCYSKLWKTGKARAIATGVWVVLNLTWSQALWFQQRLDVVKSCMYWDVPLEIENNKVQEALTNQFESLLQQYRVSFLREDLMKNVESSTYTVVKSGQRYLESMIEAHVGDKLAVPVDKDSKRRVLMDRAGYLYRLHEGYVEDERFYEKREEISVDELGSYRQVGKQLRHCSVGFLFQPCELVDLVRSSAVDKAVYAEMSRNWRNGGSQSWRPFGRNQQGADGGHVPKEVLDFMREEQRKRAEERQASEMQKHAKDAVMQMFGVHSSASDGAAAGSMQKSQPFEMLKWVAKKLSGNGGDPETSGAKQRKRRKRSTSSSGSCSSSTSLRAFRKKDKDKQKKKNKDEKKKARSDKKEKKTVERKLRPLTSSPLSVDKPVMSKERREELVKNLKLKIAEDVLMGDDWITEVAHAAKKDDLQKLAEKNGLSKTGSKHEIVEKIIAFMCGK